MVEVLWQFYARSYSWSPCCDHIQPMEWHLFPHVEFPRDIGICVIFIAGPAVQLSLDDFSLDGQLSGDCKHKRVTRSFHCLRLGVYIALLPFETLTCRRSSVHTGASGQRGRFHGLGKLWPCTFFMLEALGLLLALTRKKKGHLILILILILIVCKHRMHTLHTGRGGFAIWSFNISIASWCGSAFFANFFASPFLHTHTHTQ